ncbi:MAG: helix-turn-helix domain-containing protein [Pseudonocardiaceae bacterium]
METPPVRGVEILAEEREIISRELAAGRSYRSIGRLLNRDHTVVSREVARNGGCSAYRAIPAQPASRQQPCAPETSITGDEHSVARRGECRV